MLCTYVALLYLIGNQCASHSSTQSHTNGRAALPSVLPKDSKPQV